MIKKQKADFDSMVVEIVQWTLDRYCRKWHFVEAVREEAIKLLIEHLRNGKVRNEE